MNVSILSMQAVDNIGSLLQAYALKSMVEQQGHTVSFRSIKIDEQEKELIRGCIYENKNESDKGKRIDKYFFNRALNKIYEKRQKHVFDSFRNKYFYPRKEGMIDDCSIIGSDEVFNCLSPSPWGLSSQLFGNVHDTQKVITYAASCGATMYSDLPEPAKELICNSLKKVEAMSARDNNTVNFLQSFNCKHVIRHLDPVLVYDFSNELNQFQNVTERLPSNYLLIYSYHNRIHRNNEIEAIKKFAKEHNLKIISIGQSQYWIKDNIVVNPFEAISVFAQASFVITDTFHGAILAAKYASKYAIVIRESNSNKLYDLTRILQITDHISWDLLFEKQLTLEKGSEIYTILANEMRRTYEYLKRNI